MAEWGCASALHVNRTSLCRVASQLGEIYSNPAIGYRELRRMTS